jgi:hypothetical protein
MPKYLILFFCVFFVVPVHAEEADTSFIFKAGFIKHELQDYNVSLSTYTIREGDTTALETVKSKVEINIKDSTAGQFIISWKFSDFQINTANWHIKDLVSMAKPVTITYRASREGILWEILDWKSISYCLEDGMKKVVENYTGRNDSTAKAELKKIFAFKESLESMMLRSVRMFHQAYGLGYDVGKIVDVPSEIIGVVSQNAIPAIIKKKLVTVDRQKGIAVLSTATLPDRNALTQDFEKQYPGVKIPSSLIEMTITGGLISDISTSWVLYTFEQREENSNKNANGEILELKHSKFIN